MFVIANVVGVLVVMRADKVMVSAVWWGVEIADIARISAAGNTVVVITAINTGS